jgi:O-antigen ligase
MRNFVIMFVLSSLAGNLYPVFNVLAILCMFPAYYLWRQQRASVEADAEPRKAIRFLKWAYAYWVLSYLMTGAPLGNFLSFDFMRRDGAILVAYSSLFLFGDLGLDTRFVRRGVTLFLTVMALVATLGMLEFEDKVGVSLGLSDLPDSLQFVHYARLSEYGFHGLFQAHNSAGAVYGLAACLTLSFLIFMPSSKVISWQTFAFVACVTGLVLSKSRTSYVAFLATLALVFLVSRKHFKKVLKIGALVVVPLIYFWLSQPEVTDRVEAITSLDDPNVIGRLEHYSEAVNDITLSPLIGIGFGRFNDDSKEFSGAPGYVYVATQGEIVNDSSHAHNSYLHFWAEGGIVGLGLMLGVWISLLQWVRMTQSRFAEGTFGYAFARGIQACIVLEFLISFTEHSMGTAVTSLTVFSMVGLLRNLVADQCWAARQSKSVVLCPMSPIGVTAGPQLRRV